MKLKLDKTKEVVTLRLLLVDTPESVKKGVDPQPYSIEASNFAKNTLVTGDTVYIEYDEGSKTDKYDRHLGYLWYYSTDTSNWQMFNETLISKGYARVGYIYSQKRHLDELYKAQDYAKSNKLNIWSVDGYVTDKGFDVEAYNSNTNTSSSDSSSSSNSNSSSNTVYANGGSSSSNKYHSTKNAHNMKGAIKMTEKEAKSKGYVPMCHTYISDSSNLDILIISSSLYSLYSISSFTIGKSTVNIVPSFILDSTLIFPLCNSTNDLTIDKPIPVPSFFLVIVLSN